MIRISTKAKALISLVGMFKEYSLDNMKMKIPQIPAEKIRWVYPKK